MLSGADPKMAAQFLLSLYFHGAPSNQERRVALLPS